MSSQWRFGKEVSDLGPWRFCMGRASKEVLVGHTDCWLARLVGNEGPSTFTLVYYGILGIHEPSFPTRGQLDWEIGDWFHGMMRYDVYDIIGMNGLADEIDLLERAWTSLSLKKLNSNESVKGCDWGCWLGKIESEGHQIDKIAYSASGFWNLGVRPVDIFNRFDMAHVDVYYCSFYWLAWVNQVSTAAFEYGCTVVLDE